MVECKIGLVLPCCFVDSRLFVAFVFFLFFSHNFCMPTLCKSILLFVFSVIGLVLILVVLILAFISLSCSFSIDLSLVTSSHRNLKQQKSKNNYKPFAIRKQPYKINLESDRFIFSQQSTKRMDKIVNIINLTGWLYLQFHVGIHLFMNPQQFAQSDITFDVHLLRFIQTFQIMDIILILIGLSKGSIFGAVFQILGRLTVAWGFIEPQSDNLKFATVCIIWALADTNRYLYYLFKNHPLTSMLRYNSFIILYPIGVFGEMLLINDYIKRHAETLTQTNILLIRGIQGSICLGLVFLYVYMLKMRKKHYSKKQSIQDGGSESEQRQRSRSPRAKRD